MALEAEVALMSHVVPAMNDVVALNVGGRHFDVSLSTLRSKPGSMLSVLLSGRYQLDNDKTDDGRVFLDRDGSQFR